MKPPVCFLVPLLVSVGLLAQSTAFNDTFADGERATQNPPASLAWFQNTTNTASLAVKNGALDIVVANDARTVWAYFPAVTLDVGDSLTLSLDFSFTSAADNGFRFALLNTNGVAPALTDLRAGPTGSYLGYGLFCGGTNNRTGIYKRDGVFASNSTSSLLDSIGSGTTTIWSSRVLNPNIGGVPAAANTPFTAVLKITRTGPDTALVTSSFSGAGTTTNGNVTFTDSSAIVNRFDTLALDLISSSLAGDMLVTRANLVVSNAPVFTSQPASRGVVAGTGALFLATAAGNPAPSYQWQRKAAGSAVWSNLPESGPYSGTTTSALLVGAVNNTMDGDQFRAVVSNGASNATSDAATLNVVAPAVAGRIVNLSILTSIDASGGTFTMGYSIGGDGTNGTKPLVIRAGGPSLGALGVPGTLTDPRIDFYAGENRIGGNDDWGGAADLTASMVSVGAFAFTSPVSKDAAALVNPPKGNNTVIVSANGGGTGSVIAEIYDATSSTAFAATTPRLINVSVLKSIGSSLTAGFSIGGSTARPVLIRAIGPSLAAFNVTGALGDPRLILFNSAQTAIARSDGWGGTPALASAFTLTGAFPISATSKDAAMMVTLQPGNYTAQVTGASGASGIALVEIYELP